MLSEIKKIKDGAREHSRKLGEIYECQRLNKEQLKVIAEAQEGLDFWRRTHLAVLEKTFEDSGN